MNSEKNTHPDNEVLVRVEGVSKKFCRSLKKSLWYGLCDIGGELNPFRRQVAEVAGSGLLVAGNGNEQDSSELATSHSPLVTPGASLRDGEFYAVRDVSFELRRGECLGLIGHNGAGKTTLLKMLNGLIKPDSGKITMRGRVGALIALGAGFNPILTGRENIYINGSVLGLSKKEIDGKMDEIIDFAEIRDFIDSPVQNYSSGMTVRLGFAVATTLDPDVLILDEILAVGDIGFVVKCLNRVRELSATAAVIFVSHQMTHVSSFCSRVFLMDRGKVVVGAHDPQEAINHYFGLATHERQLAGHGSVVFESVDIRYADGAPLDIDAVIRQGDAVSIGLDFTVAESSEVAMVNVFIDDQSASSAITCPLMDGEGRYVPFGQGRHRVLFDFGKCELNAGRYSVTISAFGGESKRILARSQGHSPFTVTAAKSFWSKIVRPAVLIDIKSKKADSA
jgi:lipopolysaccharide transport system ATP-binding protein